MIGTAPFLTVTESGLYTFTVIDNTTNCQSTDEVLVSSSLPVNFELTNDTLIVVTTEALHLFNLLENDQLPSIEDYNISLNNPQQIEAISLIEPGELLIESVDGLAAAFELSYTVCPSDCPEECKEANIQIVIEEEKLFIPNAFSPNGDNKNETWIIPGLEDFENNKMTVINRWGSIVFQAAPYLNNWDGTGYNGKPLPEGTYYFLLDKDLLEEDPIKGAVTIIR